MTDATPPAIPLRRRAALALALSLAAALLLAPSAAAQAPDFLLQMPEGQTTLHSGAGELDNPRGIAGNPVTGHIYIADRRNARISEYTAWGLFVKAWGWDVAPEGAPGDTPTDQLETCGPAEPESTPSPGLCQKGLVGDGPGQMALLKGGIAVDPAGNVWVGDLENLRVQKFSPAGEFLLMLGGEVNKTTKGNICTKADLEGGDECRIGVEGSSAGFFSNGSGGDYITHNTAIDTIFVGDKGRIQEFETDGSFKSQIPFTGELEAFASETVNALDVDSSGNLYLSLAAKGFEEPYEDVYKLSPSGAPLAPGRPGESKFEVVAPRAVAVDVAGNVYATDEEPTPKIVPEVSVSKFDASGSWIVPTKEEEDAGQFFPYVPFQGPALTALGTNVCADGMEPDSEAPGNLYIGFFSGAESHVDAYGTAPTGCEPPPENPPEVLEQFAISVGREEATLGARINPRFWTDATYYVEYGTGKCSQGGCDRKAPLQPADLTSKAINKGTMTAAVVLDGLQPGTAYRYRFVAQSSGGGPVFGIDPDGREGAEEADLTAGLEASFRTFAAAQTQACSNDALRTGPGAKLPDCRAYELVSPLQKGNADVALWVGRNALAPLLFELHQTSPSGGRLTYTSWTSFADSAGAGFVSQYLAERRPLGDPHPGWSTKGLSPPRTTSPVNSLALLNGEFQWFSEHLCNAWFRHQSAAPLAEGAIPNYPNFYRRDNCSLTPAYLPTSPAEPQNTAPEDYYELRVQGSSADGARSIFTANGRLDDDAPTLGTIEFSLYEHGPEGLRYVCFLPNGTPVSQPCAAGTAAGVGGGNTSSVHNAISADGERIFFSAYTGSPGFGEDPGAPGRIFARIRGAQTKRVSAARAQDPAWFWTAADDGSKAIFEFASGPLKDELYEVDVDTETPRLIAKGVEGPLGASEDASRIYFASTEDLDGAGPAGAGTRNLYLYQAAEGGGEPTYVFIMPLAKEDIGGYFTDPAPIDPVPAHRWARVSRDGLHAAFVSAATPTPSGYDNRDLRSGEPARQVYLYDAVDDELRCVSCNPTGARPTADNLGSSVNPVWVAARIQGWEALGHAPRVLSADGRRVFFESYEALVPHDTNGAWDVYQWEEAGRGTCTASSAGFDSASGGCIDLISSGESPRDSTFLDADPSGDNVFFGTLASLVPQDYGLNDVYAARIGGGFPPPRRVSECQGEACQSPAAAPEFPTPGSSSYKGPSSSSEAKARRCAKGKAKRFANRAKRLRRASKRVEGLRTKRRLRRKAARNAKRAKRLSRKAKRCRRANRRAR